MSIESHEDTTFFKARGFDRCHPARRWQTEIGRDVFPFGSAIASHPESTVIGTNIENVGGFWRFAKGCRRTSLCQRYLRRDCDEFVSSIQRAKNIVACAIKNLRVVIGQYEGRIPVEAVRWSSGGAWRLNRSPLTCFEMPTADCSVLAFPVDQVRILLIDSANESIAAADRKPVLIESSAVLADGRTAPRTVVI